MLMIRCLVWSLLFALTLVVTANAEEFGIYIPDSTNQQVVRFEVNESEGKLSIQRAGAITLPFAPSGLTIDKTHLRLVATSGARDKPNAAVIQLDAQSMSLIETTPLDHPTGYTSVDRNGRYFLTCNYKGGVVAVYEIKPNGAIGRLVWSLKTPHSQAHCVLPTVDNKFVYVPCVKNDNALFQYRFDEDTGKLSALTPFDARPPAMFGPRHIAYHPKLPIAFFSNEQQLGVSVYQIAGDGQLNDLQHATTMPRRSPYQKGKRDAHASDLTLSPDGKKLYVAVRDFVEDGDSIFTFAVGDDGRLSLVARSKVGDIPWTIALSPDSKIMIVSETGRKQLSAYRVGDDGALSEPASIELGSAVRSLVVQ